MDDKDYVEEALCKERCNNLRKASETGDKNIKEWLSSLDNKFWALIVLGIASLISSVGVLVMFVIKILNGGIP